MSEISLKRDDYYSLDADGVYVGGAWIGNTNFVEPKESMSENDKVIMMFSIGEQFRGQGYGKALLEKIMEAEKEKGTKTLRLAVLTENETAINFYQEHGFVIDGKVDETMYYMWKEL
jgi:ribosomal protein S18 acetylase RimI-like enzyme